jgi:hypothetical protein
MCLTIAPDGAIITVNIVKGDSYVVKKNDFVRFTGRVILHFGKR